MLEHKKRIGIDLDGVLVDFFAPLVNYMNQVLGTTLKPEDITTYDFESSPKVREQIPKSGWFHEVHEDAIRKGLYKTFKPLPYAKAGIAYLKSLGYNLEILTNRNENFGHLKKDTKNTIKELFPRVFSNIRFVPAGLTKVEVCRDFEYMALFEDRLQTLLELAQDEMLYKTLPILVDQPYNQTQESLVNKLNGNHSIAKEGQIYRIRDLNPQNLKIIPL